MDQLKMLKNLNNLTKKIYEEIKDIKVDKNGNIDKERIDLINNPLKQMLSIKEKNWNYWNENISCFGIYDQYINETLKLINKLWNN